MPTRSSDSLRRYNNLLSGINAAYHEASVFLGLSDSAMQIIYALSNFDGSCLIRDICDLSALSKQTVNSSLRKLEKDGIVVLEAAGAKAKRVVLTQMGAELAAATAARIIAAENRIYASWRSEEVEQFLKLNRRFLDDLKREVNIIKDGEINEDPIV